MKSRSIYKVPDGKLLKIFLDYDEKYNTINSISITGDFFAYPEESIEIIEKKLKHAKLNKKFLLNKINSIIKDCNIEFVGLNAESLTQGIMMCLS